MLERVPGLARALACEWLDPLARVGERGGTGTDGVYLALQRVDRDVLPRVRTQLMVVNSRQATRAHGFVDLELRFPVGDGLIADDIIVWVESKFGTQPARHQLQLYLDAVPAGHLSAVVLIAPRESLPYTDAAQVPRTVPQPAWEHTARNVSAFRVDDPVASWLCTELTTYFREANLMAPDAIRPEHLTALKYGAVAEEALALICADAISYLEGAFPHRTWDSLTESPRSKYGVGYFGAWDLPDGPTAHAWRGACLDWAIARDEGTMGVTGDKAVVFRAGLSMDKGEHFDPRRQAELERGVPSVDGSRDANLVIFSRWHGDQHERLQRVSYPQDVLRGSTLEEQGMSLGRWVEETFRAIISFSEQSLR